MIKGIGYLEKGYYRLSLERDNIMRSFGQNEDIPILRNMVATRVRERMFVNINVHTRKYEELEK